MLKWLYDDYHGITVWFAVKTNPCCFPSEQMLFSFFNNLQIDNLDIFLFRISSSGFILATLLWDSRMIDMVSFQFDFNIVFVGRYDKNQWCGSGLIVSGSTKSDNTDPDPVLKPKNLILRYVITFLRKNFINLLIKFYSSLHFIPVDPDSESESTDPNEFWSIRIHTTSKNDD